MTPMDHTQLEALQRCDTEYVYRHVRHLSGTQDSRPAYFGQVMHAGVKALYDSGDAEAAVAACAAYWQQTPPHFGAEGPKPDFRTLPLAQAIVRLYAKAYGGAAAYTVVLNERYLEHEEDSGIVDRVVRSHADGLLYVLDLKTSSWAASGAYWRQWSNSQQAAIYLDLAEHALGEGVAGFWCDHVFVSGRKDGPKPEDLLQFGPVSYSAEKREELRRQRTYWRDHARAVRIAAELGVAPKQSTRSCFRMNSACAFLEYCSADPSLREELLRRDLDLGTLVVRPWEPKERDT